MKPNYLKQVIYAFFVVCILFLLSSCSLGKSLTYQEQVDRNNYHKQLDLLWIEYSYKVDSISNEYYNKKK